MVSHKQQCRKRSLQLDIGPLCLAGCTKIRYLLSSSHPMSYTVFTATAESPGQKV